MPPVARAALVVVGFAIAMLATSAAIVAGLDRLAVRKGKLPLDRARFLHETLPSLEPGRLLLLSDSLSMGRNLKADTIGHRLDGELRRRLGDAAPPVENLAFPGIDAIAYYCFSEQIADARPATVVIGLNLFWFSATWGIPAKGQLAGWLPARRWPEVLLLADHGFGLTVDRVVFFHAVTNLGLFDAFHSLQSEQVRVRNGYWRAARLLQAQVADPAGLRFVQLNDLRATKRAVVDERATLHTVETLYQPALGGLDRSHPALRILDALIDRLRRDDIDVVVYLAPHNVEHLRSIGALDTDGLDQTVSLLRDTTARHGGRFLDLHALFPDGAFRDHMDHLTFDDPDSGMHRLTIALADFLAPSPTATHGSRPER